MWRSFDRIGCSFLHSPLPCLWKIFQEEGFVCDILWLYVPPLLPWGSFGALRALELCCGTCKEMFEDDMIELFGYHQHIFELVKVKAERVQLRRRSTTLDSSTSRPRKFSFSSTILFRFLMPCTIYFPDLVYFLPFILALLQLQFLFCPKCTCGSVFVPLFYKALLAQHSCGIVVTYSLKSRLKV